MRKAIIYVFSGTGNTAKACSIYRDEFVKNGIETTVYNVKKGFENLPDPNDFDLVGFGYPVHGFNAPEIFLQLAKNLPVANNADKTSKKEYFVVKRRVNRSKSTTFRQ